ncbi:hypothetical protein RHMOL_Rhmol03G0014000 [Rhododendron molle]|uniref:Uncharacterized protein n=1 Tax=Rhododendron molle TaxID=49168 RepID=A0ACC0PAH4_RHOML|nr:hypothetical protein RHMOL_Rhmol03G0014000 [Rhododendron molle]
MRGESGGAIFSVFVDNLPIDIRKVWIYNLFSKYGRIRDLYIPNKKSKITRNQFGFVRFGSRTEAQRAADEVNDSWVWGHKLVANMARFQSQKQQSISGSQLAVRNQSLKQVERGRNRLGHTHEVKMGNLRNRGHMQGAGRKNLSLRNRDVLVRHMGGDMVVLTFKDIAERDSMFNGDLASPYNHYSNQSRVPTLPQNQVRCLSITPFNDVCIQTSSPPSVTDVITKDVCKPKRKQKSVEEILGIPKPSTKRKGGRRKKQKCVVFRSAIAATALSVSTEGIIIRNRILLNESQAAWTVTRIIGADYLGNDEEIISKIMVTDEEEELRAALLALSPN